MPLDSRLEALDAREDYYQIEYLSKPLFTSPMFQYLNFILDPLPTILSMAMQIAINIGVSISPRFHHIGYRSGGIHQGEKIISHIRRHLDYSRTDCGIPTPIRT